MKKKLSDKDKKDWKNFLSSKNKIENKDLKVVANQMKRKVIKKIDLHGFSLDDANKTIEKFIIKCFRKSVNKIIVITGKGLRSKSNENPYVSKNLSMLRYSVPDFIKSKVNLMKIIKELKKAELEDGGGGAFYIYLKKYK